MALAGLLLLLFGAMFLTQYLMFDAHHPTFTERLRLVETSAREGEWAAALREVKQIERIWSKSQLLVAIKYSDTSFTLLNIALARLGVAVRAKDLRSLRPDVAESVFLFENITSVSPSTT